MDWLSLLLKALQFAPVVVAGIEKIHGEAPGATKKQMAMDALGVASGTASDVLPQDQPAIDAATALTSSVIDGVVRCYNVSGWKAPAPAPAPPAPAPPALAPVAAAKPAPAPVPPAPARIHVPVPAGDNNPEVQDLRALRSPAAKVGD